MVRVRCLGHYFIIVSYIFAKIKPLFDFILIFFEFLLHPRKSRRKKLCKNEHVHKTSSFYYICVKMYYTLFRAHFYLNSHHKKSAAKSKKTSCRAFCAKNYRKNEGSSVFFKYIYLKQKSNYGTILINR